MKIMNNGNLRFEGTFTGSETVLTKDGTWKTACDLKPGDELCIGGTIVKVLGKEDVKDVGDRDVVPDKTSLFQKEGLNMETGYTDAEIFTEVFNAEMSPFCLMSEAAKKVMLQYSKYAELYNIDFHTWTCVHIPYDLWNEEAYRLPLEFLSQVVEGYRVQKISGKPFKSGNKIGTIKKLVVNEQCPKKSLAYTFEEDDSCVNIEMCEMFKENHHPCCNYWMNGPVSRCHQCKDIYEKEKRKENEI